jgi:hypothetical protein
VNKNQVEIFQCDEVFVLPPFSSSESQAEKSKSIQEQFSQINHEEETSIFVEKFVIPHIFHDPVAFWLESTLSKVSNDLGYMMLIFSDHKYELHNHIMLHFHFCLSLFCKSAYKEFNHAVRNLPGIIGSVISLDQSGWTD